MSINASKQDEEMQAVSKRQTLRQLFSYLKDYKKEIVIVLIIMVITIAIITVNPLLIEYAINDCISANEPARFLMIALVGVILNIILIAGIKLRMYIMSKVSNSIVMNLRNQLFSHIQTLSISFFDSRPTGKILSRIIGDINSLKDVLEESVTTFIPEMTTLIVIAIIMVVKCPLLAISAFVTIPFLFGGLILIEKLAHSRWQEHKKKVSNVTAYVYESISGMKVIKSFCAEDEAKDTMKDLLQQEQYWFTSGIKINDLLSPLIDFTWVIASVLLYYIGIKYLDVTPAETGTLLAYAAYMAMFWNPIRNIGNFYNKLLQNISAAERVFEIINTEPTITNCKEPVILEQIKGDVVFDHVSFAYDKTEDPDDNTSNKHVLHDVSFHVRPGETIALVGPTGAGKSTIINLVSRFYDINQGRLLIDGKPIETIDIKSLRSQLGIMTQDNFLFSGTIMDNLRFGNLNATDEELIEASKLVHADDFISRLENGYESGINERGNRLSVGQRQLIALARTMAADPRILILDEATSNIDTYTEKLIQKGIDKLLADRTSFIIAHRLSTIKQADRIFVINDGRIIEEGNHESLMAAKGFYYDLVMVQAQPV